MVIWKNIPGYENLYKASTDGRILNLKTGNVLTPNKITSGYHQVTLRNNGELKYPLVHSLVARTFIPNQNITCPGDKITIHHRDNNKTNNHYLNLEWMCFLDNRKKATIDGRIPKGTQRAQAKLIEEDVALIKFMYRSGKFTQTEIAKKFGVSRPLISGIVASKRWPHVFIPPGDWFLKN